MQALNIYFRADLSLTTIEIQLEDMNLFSGRHIVYNSLNHEGSKLSLTNFNKNLMKTYIVAMSQEVYVADDRSKNCTTYPTEQCHSVSHPHPAMVTYLLQALQPGLRLPALRLQTTLHHHQDKVKVYRGVGVLESLCLHSLQQ